MIANIMLIDDSKIDLFVTQKIIEKLPIASNIRSFVSGKSAINFLKIVDRKNNYKTMFIPDVILLDINMPEMNGFEFLNEFNKLKNIKEIKVPIYMLSSSTNMQDVKKAKNERSCVGFINKPFTLEKLNKILLSYKPYLKTYDYQLKDINLEISSKIANPNIR